MTNNRDEDNGWKPERAHGLERLLAFAPKAGAEYAKLRNYDLGPGAHDHVSTLSPWIRHRLILEEEVVSAVLARHSFAAASKFIQEVFWRAYWKGWLELRPAVWRDYRRRLEVLSAELERDSNLRLRWEEAEGGSTGITCFDAWVDELTKTGYLHNHARMWFASIWIFTLKLPWELGADFFLRNLLDGDPASNTLSWRWVAGLQTKGKTYLARAENIAKFTENRFNPTSGLSSIANPLPGPSVPALKVPPSNFSWDCTIPTGLLTTEDDLSPDFVLSKAPSLQAAVLIRATEYRSALNVSPKVFSFVDGALADTRSRLRSNLENVSEIARGAQAIDHVVEWTRQNGLRQLVTPYVPVGPTADMVRLLVDKLGSQGIELIPILRSWDEASWPHATHGFFKFREKIPKILREVNMAGAS
ncbi:MAG: FAD-binding domain-containing protein [Methyloceanibacter sp.]|jgi:deoxyribodipyrimidine photo-lyase